MKRGKNLTGDNLMSTALGVLSGFGGMMFEDKEQRDQRKMAQFEKDGLEVDTCWVADLRVYETAVKRPNINDGKWLIVDHYATREDAQIGHDEWVKYLLEDKPSVIYEIILDQEIHQSI